MGFAVTGLMRVDTFKTFEKDHPSLVAVNADGDMTGQVVDFCRSFSRRVSCSMLISSVYQERLEMCTMSEPSEIAPNVFLGPTPDSLPLNVSAWPSPTKPQFDVYIETSDLAQIPDSRSLQAMEALLASADHSGPLHVEFPSSGNILPPTWSHAEVDGLMEMCSWIHSISSPTGVNAYSTDAESSVDSNGDTRMVSPSPNAGPSGVESRQQPKKVLIHCTDGYTETSLLSLTYFMFAHGLPVHTAWIELHRDRLRNFFAYPSDVALLSAIQPRILQESPKHSPRSLSASCIQAEPAWLGKIDGSLPSRILPYMYLGNLGHANNPELLRELGITRILSVGEAVNWPSGVRQRWGEEKLMFIDRVQDNGVDSLTCDFGRCLAFIGS